MLRVALRNLLARKLRMLSSALAVVLGVAFVAGSLIFTDTMQRSFDVIVQGSSPDVTVRPQDKSGNTVGFTPDARTIPASVVEDLRSTPGAERVDGAVQSQGLYLIGPDGKLVGGLGAPTLSFNYDDAPAMTGEPVVTIPEGEPPTGPHEVVIDQSTVDRAGFEIGDTVRMTSAGDITRRTATLVGTARFGGGGLAGATLVLFDTRTAQDLFLNGRDAYNSIAITAAPGVSQVELRDDVAKRVTAGLDVITGQVIADETKDAIGPFLDFFGTVLLVFAAIAVVVGAFLIVNTFSILVAQRSRELALLRAVGASRGQVVRSVLLEAVVVGLVGSTLGLLLGLGLAAALRALFGRFGLDLSQTPLVFGTRTVIAAYVVGIAVTVVAAYLPARRASRIAPVAAMRDDIALPEHTIRIRMVVGAVLAVLSAALLVVGIRGEGTTGVSVVGAGVFGVLMAATLLSPVLGVPVLRALEALYRPLFGLPGRLAAQNSLRNPRRTAATASALMIGLALVSMIAILGASLNKSIEVSARLDFQSDYLLSNPTFTGFSPSVTERVRALDEAGKVAETRLAPGEIDGDRTFVTGADTTDLDAIYDFTMKQGRMRVGHDEVALSGPKATALGAHVGDSVTLTFPAGKQRARVVGIYRTTSVVGDAVVPFSTLRAAKLPERDFATSVDAADGTSYAALGAALERVVEDDPLVTVQNQQDFIDTQRAQVDQLVMLVYALLGLAVVIAVLGIVNTLALSVLERTREIGLLRAVGVSRRQLRRIVRLESVAIALLGAVLGVALGCLFGVVLQRSLVDEGFTDLAIPVVRLLAFVVAAVLVGVLAAVLPARRAARLNVLTAIAQE